MGPGGQVMMRPNPNVDNQFAGAPAGAPFGSYEDALADFNTQRETFDASDADWLGKWGPDADRGLIGDIGDVLSGPIDFDALQSLDLSNFQGINRDGLPGMPQTSQFRGVAPGGPFQGVTPGGPFSNIDPSMLPGMAQTSQFRGVDALGGFQGIDLTGLQNLDPASAELIRSRGGLARDVDRAIGSRENQLGSRQHDIAMVHDAYRRRLGADQQRQQQTGRLDLTHALAGPQDFGAQRGAVEQATFGRAMNLLAPQFQRQEQDIMVDLQNRGIPINSEAFGERYGQFTGARDRAMTDTALASVLAGGGEHQRLADLSSRNRAQLFGEGGQRFGESGQLFQDARDVFDDRGDIFDDGGDVFGETVQGNQFMESLNRGTEQERHREFGRELSTRQQQMSERELAASFANQNIRDEFGQQMSSADLANRNMEQMFAQQQQLRAMGFSEQQAMAMLGNQNQRDEFGQQMSAAQLANQNQRDQFGQEMSSADMANRNAQQRFQQQAQLRSMGFSEEQAVAIMANQNATNRFGQQQTLRQQQLAETEMARTQPLNDLMRLLGGVPNVGMPQFPQVGQYGIQSPDYQGMVGSNYASQANQWGQQQAASWACSACSAGQRFRAFSDSRG